MTGEEIRARLTAFAAKWSVYDGTERAEAQTFLNQLFDCYGTNREAVARFEPHQAGGFLDLLWPRVCLIEMKAPSEARRLDRHRPQALDYWRNAADAEAGVPAPEWVVICAFRTMEIWQPGAFPNAPRLVVDLIDLPDQYDALLFLAGRDPVFTGGQAKLTLDAVSHLVAIYHSLRDRRAADLDVVRDFLLQAVWCLFAEDLGQIPEHRFSNILENLIADQRRSSADELGNLFTYLNTPGGAPNQGIYAGTPYANGGLFAAPARVHLNLDELHALRLAAQSNWREVQPSIFGSLLEGGLGHDQQWRLGAHYTHEADIQKVVQPTIVQPWRERIENLDRHREAMAAQYDLLQYVVLDPACGSGNFLYVAYRELRRIERRLNEREQELRRAEGLQDRRALDFFPLSNIKGIEIEGFAVALARVTLWMGHKLAVDELDLTESTLPLSDLSGIQIGDALRLDWPRANAIIGNPPFHGDRNLRRLLGDDYVEWLRREFRVGVKDYCVYWFRKAHQSLEANGRAGLVGTNSISQNRARGASLEFIVGNGGVITSAVSTQDWPGEAAVDVSIVNWVKQPNAPVEAHALDGIQVPGITPSLRSTDQPDVASAGPLAQNTGRAFQGPIPRGGGFLLTLDEADLILQLPDARYSDVIRAYITGEDISNNPEQQPSRAIIDFGALSLEAAERYPRAMEIVRERVKPDRDRHDLARVNRGLDPEFSGKWWRLWRPRPEFRGAVDGLGRYIGGTATGKRILFAWCAITTCPSNAMNAFAFDDDYAFGVLTSRIHTEWARVQSSTLEDRIRYTPSSAFETFPWPEPDDVGRTTIAEVASGIVARRHEICMQEGIGLTALYNAVDDGAWVDLAVRHRRLDEAVAVAYDWPREIAQDADQTNRRLLDLNREIAAGARPYNPF